MTNLKAYLFDLDGVLAPTAELHRKAWAALFNWFFDQQGIAEPYTQDDYFAHIDGKPRYDGVSSELASRGIDLPWGTPQDSPDTRTVCGLGNRKNLIFTQLLAEGVQPYPETRSVLDALADAGKKLALVSSSRNAKDVLSATQLNMFFPVVVDGAYSASHSLAGKPAPDTYLQAAQLLEVPAAQCAVIEDALSGVAAGHAGGFGLVVGINRGAGAQQLREAGADIVYDDLAPLLNGLEAGR
jgi:beta-phosphoglucomutase family hydrolase